MMIRTNDASEPFRPNFVEQIREAITERQLTILTGAAGLGQAASAQHAALTLSDWSVVFAEGDWLRGGYLGGFHELIERELAWSEAHAPDIVSRHEQTLKRVLPTRSSAAYRVPKDLTNSTSREERTRFYHSEYQNKLLVGLAEFLLDALRARGSRVLLVVEGASRLSPTSMSLIRIILRKKESWACLRFILLDEEATHFDPDAARISFCGYPRQDFDRHLDLAQLAPAQRDAIYRLSRGNLRTGRALKHCFARGVTATGHLSAVAVVDFYLATLAADERTRLASDYVRGGFPDDLIARRSAETTNPAILDAENASAHELALQRFRTGDGPLVLGHALAIIDKQRRIESVVEPCEVLMGIGLYDTWLSFFAPMFGDPALRLYGDGSGPVNGLFINAAFVLYAMGNARVSAPFLEEFLARFPRSRFVPTALYAQSMTYGRYQVPVDLERAEAYARRNLDLIDEVFLDHERYTYIKVFAENAYAYIKSRQGFFDEALDFCERGNAVIVATYGESRYLLHRSILIYNTSQVYEIVGDLGQAETRLREAITCDPHYAEYYNDLGNLLSKIKGREREALEAYDRAVALSPPYYEAHLNRGALRSQLGQVTEAVSDFERALEIKPEEWRALRELGNTKLQRGDVRGALEAYSRALDHEDRDADLHANAGLAHSELGETDAAILHYRKAITLQPTHAAAHNNLAAEFYEQRRFREALEHARMAAKYGEDPDFSTNLAAMEARQAAHA